MSDSPTPHSPAPGSPAPEGRRPNRLARETSPYLLQHAHNPVDWYPWGEEAFARARAEDKPILLSVGYATCHWCHVMERESFEDDAIAALLAERFVAIKVDREELPDVDHVYMSALQALTGHGGWPMNMFLTPALEPFYGGTYFPPVARQRMPSFGDVLIAVSQAWRERRADLAEQARTLVGHLRNALPRGDAAAEPSSALHRDAVESFARSHDREFGGFGSAPKFPQSPLLQYLLTLAAAGSAQARAMLATTLARMHEGGTYDHVGGGFARYSTDRRWHVPHFEKMLYDNAQLVRVYLGAWRLTGDARLRFVAEDTLAYLEREMRPAASPDAFSSGQDADAEGVEGRFHVWTEAQFEAVLGDDARAAARLYGVSAAGNWEHGSNVLERRDPAAARAALAMDQDAFERWERSVRERLYAARAARVWPITDDKVLADWNGMALRAFAEAGRLLGRADLVDAARRLARFLLATMRRDGLLRHAWRNGKLRDEFYLSDLAQAGLGLLELHAASAQTQWLLEAQAIAAQMIERLHDGEGFFDAAPGALPVRARDLFDGATPSGTAAACELLIRLSGPSEREDWREIAVRELDRHAATMARAPSAMPAMLHARLLADHGADLALPTGAQGPGAPGPGATGSGAPGSGATGSGAPGSGAPGSGAPGSGAPAPAEAAARDADARVAPGDDLTAYARTAFAPLVTIVAGPAGSSPLLAGRRAGEAYLCRHGECRLPARTARELRAQLEALHGEALHGEAP